MSPSPNPASLSTVHLVLPTPFTSDGRRLVPEQLGEFVRQMAWAGIRVFLPAAGTGEFHSLSAEEAAQCVEITRKAAGPAAVVFAPVGLGLGHAIEIGRRGLEAGADALLLMPPIHPCPSDAGFRDYFQAISDAVPLPIFAYKKGPVPSDALLTQLGGEGRLAGVKYADNEMDAFVRFADANAGRLGLYCGTAERYAPFFMLAGATGYTSGAGCLCPRLTLRMHAALEAGKYPEAMRLLQILRPIEDERARDGDATSVACIKYGLERCGYDFGPPRPPWRRLTDGEKLDFRRRLDPILAAEIALASPAPAALAGADAGFP